MSESSNQRTRRRSERAQQLYNARMMPDAEDTYEPSPAQDRAAARRQAYEQRMAEPAAPSAFAQPAAYRGYDESRFTANEYTGASEPVQESEFRRPVPAAPSASVQPAAYRGYDESRFTPNEFTGESEPVQAYAPDELSDPLMPGEPWSEDEFQNGSYATDAEVSPSVIPFLNDRPEPTVDMAKESAQPEPAPATERSALAANLSAYYRRAANVSAQEHTDPFAPLDWPAQSESSDPNGEDAAASVNVYRMQEASWAQEERQSMLQDAGGYQVKTEERRQPGKRRRKKRLVRNVFIGTAAALAVIIGAIVLLHQQQPEAPVSETGFTPVVTTTPQPIRGYDAAPAMAVSGKADEAISQISGPVEMATCAVTEGNVLTRSMRADGLFDYYLFASDGRLLAYFDKLPQNGMFPMKGGGFYTAMEPWLVDEEGRAMIPLAGLEETTGSSLTLRPLMNGWAQIIANDGESNLINREGQLLSRLWFSRSFPMTGTESVAYVDTGVEGSATRYTLYVLDGKDAGNAVKWQDAADDQGVVTCALGMAYLQNGELYKLSALVEDPAALPLCTTANVRFYTDCGAVVVQDAATGKYALYVNGEQHYDYVYDSILPVESDVRWQGDILTGTAGQAMVLAVSGAKYPQPLSHYFVLTRDGAQEYVALSAVTNCPILLN